MSTEETKDTKSNEDKVSVKFLLSKEIHKKLKIKAIEQDKTIQDMLVNIVSTWVEK